MPFPPHEFVKIGGYLMCHTVTTLHSFKVSFTSVPVWLYCLCVCTSGRIYKSYLMVTVEYEDTFGSDPTCLYAAHLSALMTVPGATWSFMMGNNVLASRCWTISIYPTPGVCEVSTNPRTKFPDEYGFLCYSVYVWIIVDFVIILDVVNHEFPFICNKTNFHPPEQ